jgi:alpha-beta hydrolase superfamily lysophospholipase
LDFVSAPTRQTLTYSDGYQAFARWWPTSQAGPAVLYLHGIQSHGGWYESSAARLAAAGCAVLLPDRRGSGENTADRGHAPNARRLLLDVREAGEWLRRNARASRVDLIGVSWGGKLALAAHVASPSATRSLSLVAPGLFPVVDIPAMQKLKLAAAVLLAPRRRFPIPLGEPNLFTENAQRQRYIRDDALSLRDATAACFWASRRLDVAARAARASLPTPLRVFLAERDRIIDNAATRAWVRSLEAWPTRGVVEYHGASHSLEFEPDPSGYLDDLVDWVTQGGR